MRPRLSASTHPGSCGRGAKARTPTALVPSRARPRGHRLRELWRGRRHAGPPTPALPGQGSPVSAGTLAAFRVLMSSPRLFFRPFIFQFPPTKNFLEGAIALNPAH